MLNNSFTPDAVLESIVLFITCIIASYYVIRAIHVEQTKRISYELFEKIYSPAFHAIEPYLYKTNLNNECMNLVIDNVLDIVNKHPHLATPRIKRYSDQFKTCKTDDAKLSNYLAVCRDIDKYYDKLCSRLKFPKRSLQYRIFYKQYENKSTFYFWYIIYLPRDLFLFLFSYLVISIIISTLFTYLRSMMNPIQDHIIPQINTSTSDNSTP